MRKIPFTISFVTTFTNEKEVARASDAELEIVCRQGLVDLLEQRFMPEINKNARTITVEVAS